MGGRGRERGRGGSHFKYALHPENHLRHPPFARVAPLQGWYTKERRGKKGGRRGEGRGGRERRKRGGREGEKGGEEGERERKREGKEEGEKEPAPKAQRQNEELHTPQSKKSSGAAPLDPA